MARMNARQKHGSCGVAAASRDFGVHCYITLVFVPATGCVRRQKDRDLGSPSRPTKLQSMEDFPYEDLSGAIESTDHHVPSIKKHLLQSPVRKIKKRRLSLPAVRL